jgi:CRP-like cAMP-binding protein
MPEISLFRHADTQREYAAGDVVCAPGDPATEMFAVISGRVEVFHDGELLDTVEPGGIFGEVALLVGPERPVEARAAEPSVLAIVDEDEFLRLVKMNPYFALEVMRIMAERLARMV